jgi:hypothetical protein
MGEVFQHRLIISGFEVEYYFYKDKSIYRGFGAREKREKQESEIVGKDEKIQEAKSQSSVNRTRKEIRRRINSNPQLTKFLTLTFGDNITDIATANRKLNLFSQRAKDRWKEFQYLAVPEFQKSGRVHYHLLCDLRYVKSQDIEKVWGEGFINIRRLYGNLGWYLCKYLNKDMFDKRMFRKKKYFCSQDLKKPMEMVGKKVKVYLEKNSYNLKIIRETNFHNEFIGEVEYKLLNFTTLGLDLKTQDDERKDLPNLDIFGNTLRKL